MMRGKGDVTFRLPAARGGRVQLSAIHPDSWRSRMTKLRTKILGKEEVLEQQAVHFLSEAIDEFLIAEYPDTVLGSLIKLSIGLELFLKKELEGIEPALLWLDESQWKAIHRATIPGNCRKIQKQRLLAEFRKIARRRTTVKFGIVIEVFPYFWRIPKRIAQDLNDLKEYRNGLFHWKADDRDAFELSQQALRLIKWMLRSIERRLGWPLGGEMNAIDPMFDKRRQLADLCKCAAKSENAFNVQRRIFRHKKEFDVYCRIEARLKGWVVTREAKDRSIECPACAHKEMEVFESGSQRDGKWEERILLLRCKRCAFYCSDVEFEAVKSDGTPSLEELFRGS